MNGRAMVREFTQQVGEPRTGYVTLEEAPETALRAEVAVALGRGEQNRGVDDRKAGTKVVGQPGRGDERAGQPADTGSFVVTRHGNEASSDPGGTSGDAGRAVRRSTGDPVAQLRSVVMSRRRSADDVFVVAIDGRGGSGKSTLATRLADATGAALVRTDDFFRQPGDTDTPEICCYYDWRRLRAEALEPLRSGREASFCQYDWAAGRDSTATVTVQARRVLLVEGVFSGSPELSDLVDYAVLVVIPDDERLRRLRRRVAPDEWDDTWLRAELSYFERRRPPHTFDLVVPGTFVPAS